MYFYRWLRPRPLNPAVQIVLIQHFFPGFSYRGRCGRYVFRGALQPRPDGAVYHVEIRYTQGTTPKVFVIGPQLEEDAPHLFADGSLCLFHPQLFRWHGRRIVARWIVPRTAAWLYFYEHWLNLGVWLGPEAPHALPTSDDS